MPNDKAKTADAKAKPQATPDGELTAQDLDMVSGGNEAQATLASVQTQTTLASSVLKTKHDTTSTVIGKI
jgi:hypothetical protein